MNINLEEIVQEVQTQFPKEFTICVQAIQIRKLQEQVEDKGDGDELSE